MTTRSAIRGFSLVLGLWFSLATPGTAGTLPSLEADSLSGTHVVLPRDAAGKSLILLLAYTKESQPDLQAWSRKLIGDRLTDNAALFVVVVADKTAFFARKGIRKTVRDATAGNSGDADSKVLITFNGDGWRQLVPPGDKKTIGVVVCDAAGEIRYAKREPFNRKNLTDVEQAVKAP